jgi:hypothetical protein
VKNLSPARSIRPFFLGRLICYGLLPTIIHISDGGCSPPLPTKAPMILTGESVTPVSIFADILSEVNSARRAFAACLSDEDGFSRVRIITPTADSPSNLDTPRALHFAPVNSRKIVSAKGAASAVGELQSHMSAFTPGNICIRSTNLCCCDNVRGARLASSFTRARRSCSAFWLASAARAFASAVAVSFAEIRSFENCSLIPDVMMAPMVPISTAAAPMTSTRFENANKRSAKDEDISHINSLTVLGFAVVCVLAVFANFASIWRAVRIWRR